MSRARWCVRVGWGWALCAALAVACQPQASRTPASEAAAPEAATPEPQPSSPQPSPSVHSAPGASEPPASPPGASEPSASEREAHGHGSEGLHKDFSDTEKFARQFDDPARDAWQKPDEVIRLLAIAPGSTVADIGAGTGYFLPRLSKAVGPSGNVLALDVEPKMVEAERRRAEEQGLANVRARVVAPDDPGLPGASVDRILIVNTWHHIDDRARYAEKLARALTASGQVWIVDYTLDAKQGPPVRHRLAPEKVLDELRRGGLRAELVEESLPRQFVVRGTRRQGPSENK